MVARREVGDVLPFRLRPFLDPDNEAFWTGGADQKLRIVRCRACGLFIHPATPRCRRCRSADVAPEVVSGRARVRTFTINHQPWIPESQPYIIALVELPEQPNLILTTNLVDVEGENVFIGMDVKVVFEEDDGIFFPLFRPVAQPRP